MDWTTVILGTAGTFVTVFSGIKAFTFVNEAEIGVKTRYGRAIRDKETNEIILIKPGGRWLLPFAEKIEKLRVSGNIVNLKNMTITLKNNLTYSFSGYVMYDVVVTPEVIEKILFRQENRDIVVENLFQKAIQKELHRSDELDVQASSIKIRRALTSAMEELGWIVTDCAIVMFTETPTSQFLRGVDYRIQKALEYKDELPENILCAALGVNAVVTIEEKQNEQQELEETENPT